MDTIRYIGIRVKTQKPREEDERRDLRNYLQADILEHAYIEAKCTHKMHVFALLPAIYRNKTTQNPLGILTVTAAEPGWGGRETIRAAAISAMPVHDDRGLRRRQRRRKSTPKVAQAVERSPVRSHCYTLARRECSLRA